ncbi:MAG: hypothetical protein L0G81_12645 [Ewingella sp.]|nr:hypothetical protein [Ewingella sp.]
MITSLLMRLRHLSGRLRNRYLPSRPRELVISPDMTEGPGRCGRGVDFFHMAERLRAQGATVIIYDPSATFPSVPAEPEKEARR